MEQDMFADHLSVLTSAQSEFNELSRRTIKLKEKLASFPGKKHKIVTFYNEHDLPLIKTYNELVFNSICVLDAHYESAVFNEDDKFDISGIILTRCSALVGDLRGLGEKEQKATNDLLRKHEIIQSGLTAEKFDKLKVEELLEMYTTLIGLKPTAKMKKAKSVEEALNLIEEYLISKKKKESNPLDADLSEVYDPIRQEPETEPRRRATQAEFRSKMQEDQTKMSINTIYAELSKKFQPELEQDEARRAIKEERMKKSTEAYQNNDLATLLSMQVLCLEESIEANHADQPDTLLEEYNNVLREQLEELEKELYIAIYMIPDLPEELCDLFRVPDEEVDMHLKMFLRDEEEELKLFRKECESLKGKKGVNKLLREYRETKSLDDLLSDSPFDD